MRELGHSIDSLDFLSSSNDRLIIIEQDDWEHEPIDITHAYLHQPFLISGDLGIQRTEITVPVRLRGPVQPKMKRGKETIGGGITLAASIADSSPLLFSMYTQTLQPEWYILGTTSRTFPDPVTVVASPGDLATTLRAPLADNLASTRNPIQLTATPISNDITVVNNQNLAPGTALQIDDTLGPPGTDVPVTTNLVISFSNAALTDPSGTGTLTIVYLDGSRTRRTHIETLTAGHISSTNHPIYIAAERVISITPSGFSAGTISVMTNPATLIIAQGNRGFTYSMPILDDLGPTGSNISGMLPITVDIGGRIGSAFYITVTLNYEDPDGTALSESFSFNVRRGSGGGTQTRTLNIGRVTSVSVSPTGASSYDTYNRGSVTIPRPGTTIATDQDLSSGDPITLINVLDAGGSNISGSFGVKTELTNAALTTPATPGTITIVYRDPDGNNQTATYSFANNALSTEQSQILRVDELVSVTPSGFSAGTASVVVSDIPVIADNVPVASLQISGTDNWDRPISEELQWTPSTVDEPRTTEYYYKTVTAVHAASAASHTAAMRVPGWTAGTYQLTGQNTSIIATFRPQDKEAIRFWTVEYAKGGKPNVYYGLIANSVSFSIAENTAREDTITFLGRRGEPNTNLAKTGVVYNPDGSTTFPEATDDSSLQFASEDIYTGWQAFLEFDGNIQPLITCEFTMELGYVDSQLTANQIYNIGKPVRDGLRSITLNATVSDSKQMDYWGIFRNGRTIPDVKMIFRNAADGAFPVIEAWMFPQAQITASPDPAVSGQGRINVNLTVVPFNDKIGDPNDWRVETNLPRYTAPRTYTLST